MIDDNFPVEAELKVLMYLFVHKETEFCQNDIAKKLDITYSHIVKRIRVLKNKELVKFEVVGRTKLITLTKSGQECASHLVSAKSLFLGGKRL